jgi:hypothetical protein
MKVLLRAVVFGVVLGVSYYGLTKVFASSCDRPVRYALGSVDERFGMGGGEIMDLMRQAEEAWDRSVGKNVLEYDPQAALKVNFVFDERQRQTLETRRLESQLEKVETTQAGISDDYDRLAAQYAKKLAEYKADVAAYERDFKKYDKKVAEWNRTGGTEKEYEKLVSEGKEFVERRDSLEEERRAVNALVDRMNALAKQDKRLVEAYNSELATYRERYGGERQFDQGVYTGQEINVYQFREAGDLRLVLAHELGHALGLAHTDDPASVMYYLMGEQDVERLTLTQEDTEALRAVCRSGTLEGMWDTWRTRIAESI